MELTSRRQIKAAFAAIKREDKQFRWDNYGEKKANEKKKKRLSKLLLFIIIVILFYLFVFKTNFFIISDIIVEGNAKLNYNTIVKASNCSIGENIFRVDTENGESNLKLIPYIKNSKINRKLPNKVIIEIEERKEVAVINYLEHGIYIDNEGYILEVVDNIGEVSLPVIIGMDIVYYEEGSNVYHNNSIDNINELISYSVDLKISGRMKEIDVSNVEDINIQLNDGILVAFGPLNNVKYKLSFLVEILQDIEKKNLEVKKILFNKGENPIIVMDNR